MELLNHSPPKCNKLQFVGWQMDLSLDQTPADIGYDGISPIIMGLVEESPQTGPASIGVQLERLGKVSIGQNGCCSAQILPFIECLLAPVIPGDGCPHLTCIFARHQCVQGLDYLHKIGDKLAIVSCEPKKLWTSVMVVGMGHILIKFIFSSLITNPWVEMMCPRYMIYLQNSSHCEGLRFSLACSSFWYMASSLTRCLARSFEKMTISSR